MVLIILLQAAHPYISSAACLQYVPLLPCQSCMLALPLQHCQSSEGSQVVMQCLLTPSPHAMPLISCTFAGACCPLKQDPHVMLPAQVQPPVPSPSAPYRRQPQFDGHLLRSYMLTPLIQRCHNPWCATRVGEARVPGPPVAKRPSQQSPARESRRRIRSKGPPRVPSTISDNANVDSAMDTAEVHTCDPPLSVPAEVERSQPPADAGPSQAPGDTTSYPMLFVHTVDETHLKLRCYYIHANSCWRWQTSGRGAVLSRSSRKSPVEALRAWEKRYGAQLTEESRIEVQNALSIMDDSPQMATPPPKGASQMSMLSDAAPVQIPIEEPESHLGCGCPHPKGHAQECLARWNEWVDAMDKPTMRKLPRSTHQLLARTLDWLVKIVEDLDQPDVVRDTAELLVLCAPTSALASPCSAGWSTATLAT